MQVTHFSHNGELLPIEQAVVSLNDIAYSYGFGVYETLRVSGGIIYFVHEHVERLLHSAEAIELAHNFSHEFIEQALSALVQQNQAQACNIKVMLIGGPTATDAQLYMQCLNPLYPDRKLYSHGATLITEPYERRYPQAKTLNMLPSYLAYRKAQRAQAYDALLVDREGNITEGTRTNFFVMKGKAIISAPEDRILSGVMRKVMLKVATEHGYTIEERNIHLDDLPDYDAAFLTSTSSKVMPVLSIGSHSFGETTPELKELMRLVDDFLANSQGKLE